MQYILNFIGMNCLAVKQPLLLFLFIYPIDLIN